MVRKRTLRVLNDEVKPDRNHAQILIKISSSAHEEVKK
jgi:hypothetical protein